MTMWLEKRTWEEFSASGLLWWINRTLHLFGWAIVIEVEEPEKVKVLCAYPARCHFRGFCRDSEDEGFKKLSQYMIDRALELREDCERESGSGGGA